MIDWGVQVVCIPNINFIYVQGNLQYLAPVGETFDVDVTSKTCYDHVCSTSRDYLDADDGTYRVWACYSASSPESDWPYHCLYRDYTK